MSAIDEILWLLKDGKWHDLIEIFVNCSTQKSKAKIAFSFLLEYGFIQVSENGQKARLHRVMLNFISEVQRVENEGTLRNKSFECTVGVKEFTSLCRSSKDI